MNARKQSVYVLATESFLSFCENVALVMSLQCRSHLLICRCGTVERTMTLQRDGQLLLAVALTNINEGPKRAQISVFVPFKAILQHAVATRLTRFGLQSRACNIPSQVTLDHGHYSAR